MLKSLKTRRRAVCKPPKFQVRIERNCVVCTDNNKLSQRLRNENEIAQFLSKKSGNCLDWKILNALK